MANDFDVTQLKAVDPDKASKIKLAAHIALAAAVPAAAAAVAPTLAVKPGVERWPVKTGMDKDVANVGKNVVNGEDLGPGVVETTVEEMVRIPLPTEMQPPVSSVFQDHRSDPVELTIWRLDADIIELKMEADGDYHLVLQGDSGETMIGEVPNPDPRFVPATSPFAANIAVARKAVEDKLVKPLHGTPFVPVGKTMVPRSAVLQSHSDAAVAVATTQLGPANAAAFKSKIKNTRATLTGVGFFDRIHGQDGVSQSNGIELHPVLEIEWKP